MTRAIQNSESSPSPASPQEASGSRVGSHSDRAGCICPPGQIHSTDPRWKPDNHEERLLAFAEELTLDLARNHPSVTKQDISALLARVVDGTASAKHCEELHAWQKKAALANEVLAKFPDCPPAKAFLERFKEKFGYEYGL